jgi:hypothetical protein
VVGAMTGTFGSMELELQRRVTPDGSSVALLVVRCAYCTGSTFGSLW